MTTDLLDMRKDHLEEDSPYCKAHTITQ